MIAKIAKSSSNFFAVAHYHQEKIDKGVAEIIDYHLLYSRKPKQVGRIMDVFSQYGSVEKPVFHVSLNFALADLNLLDDEKFRAISKEYLEEMGYGKQPYIVYRHDDTSFPHLHILSTRVDIKTQKRVADSFEWYHSKKVTKKLELKYGLIVAETQSENYQQIEKDVKAALSYTPLSFEELNEGLEKIGSLYRIKLVKKGLIYYRADEPYQAINPFWKGSKFKEKGYDKSGLEKIFWQNTREWLSKVLVF